MKCSLVLSYDEHDAYTCWVSYHTNDRFCTSANLICFSECLSCSFILKDSQGGTVMRQLRHIKVYTMWDTNIFVNIPKENSFPLSHPQICILDGSLFHCCFLLLVYMLHLLDGGPTLEMEPMDLQVKERSDLLDAPSNLHSCHDIDISTPTPPYLLIVLTHVMLDGHIIHMKNLHLMHGLTHIMIALLHLVFPCHP